MAKMLQMSQSVMLCTDRKKNRRFTERRRGKIVNVARMMQTWTMMETQTWPLSWDSRDLVPQRNDLVCRTFVCNIVY